MFYDYFDELPPVIDDDNQETYYALSSLQNQEDTLNDPKSSKIPNMNLLKDAFLKKANIFQYFCAVCGHTVLLTTSQIENSKRRREDGSYIISLENTERIKSDLILKNNTSVDRKIRIIDDHDPRLSEIRQFYSCKNCKILIFYVLKNEERFFILSDAIVIDNQQANFFLKVSRIPNLAHNESQQLD